MENYWLVVWNMCYFSLYWKLYFSEGLKPPTRTVCNGKLPCPSWVNHQTECAVVSIAVKSVDPCRVLCCCPAATRTNWTPTQWCPSLLSWFISGLTRIYGHMYIYIYNTCTYTYKFIYIYSIDLLGLVNHQTQLEDTTLQRMLRGGIPMSSWAGLWMLALMTEAQPPEACRQGMMWSLGSPDLQSNPQKDGKVNHHKIS